MSLDPKACAPLTIASCFAHATIISALYMSGAPLSVLWGAFFAVFALFFALQCVVSVQSDR